MIDVFVKEKCYDWEVIKLFVDAFKLFNPKFPQSDNEVTRMYTMFERYLRLLVVQEHARTPKHTNSIVC